MGYAFGDAAEGAWPVEAAAADNDEVGTLRSLGERVDRCGLGGNGVRVAVEDPAAVDPLASESDDPLQGAVVPAGEVACDLPGALGRFGAVQADDDLAWEVRLVGDRSRDEDAARRPVQQVAGDAAEDDFLESGVSVCPDGEKGRVESLRLVEKLLDDEAVEAAGLGGSTEDSYRRVEGRGPGLFELGGEVGCRLYDRRRLERRARVGQKGGLAAGVESFLRAVDPDHDAREDRVRRSGGVVRGVGCAGVMSFPSGQSVSARSALRMTATSITSCRRAPETGGRKPAAAKPIATSDAPMPRKTLWRAM